MQQERHDDHLRERHHPARQARGAVDAVARGQARKSHLAIAVHRLEVVQRHDAVRTEAVEKQRVRIGQPGKPPSAAAAAVNQGRPS